MDKWFYFIFSMLGSLIVTIRLRSKVYLNHQLKFNAGWSFEDINFGEHFQ